MTASIVKPSSSPVSSCPTNLRLREIIDSLPGEVFLQNPRRAAITVSINVLMVSLGYFAIAFSPWFLLPFAWIFTGTAMTGLFVIGHDCGHRSFARRNWVNNLVGHIMFLPLFYPFHSWRILHNYHHKHTNKHGVDNAWDPLSPEDYANAHPLLRWSYSWVRGRLWWLGSIGHWAILHFKWQQFEGKQRQQVRFSVMVVLLGAAIALPTLIATTGIWGFVKFWLLPWLVYHFWMSTFTIVHHTIPEIPFTPSSDWHEAQAQLSGTVHCDYPRWVEFLCHDINVHIPHHISTAIPWYNLRQAHRSLKENWGEYLQQKRFSWSLMQEITDKCHLYDADNYYQTFEEHRQSYRG